MKARVVWAAVALLLFGAARLPVEHAIHESHRAAHFRGARLNLELREEIGQLAFIAALSGFRALVADALYIQAYSAWERTEWGRMARLFSNVTALQPRVLMFWEMAGWHMAWNASVAAYENPEGGREAIRLRAQRQYWDLGRDFFERGIRNNPDRWELHGQLAQLYRDKYRDPCAAAEHFARAAAFADAPPHQKRFAAYELSKCPGREREGYEALLALYRMGPSEQKPTLLTRIRETEALLGIPEEQRVVKAAPDSAIVPPVP
jgi:hypothetical protein